jgi:hypothetical protein
MKRRSNLLLPLAVTVSLLMVGSCAIPLTDLDEAEENVPLHVTALAVGTPISTLVVEVTAEDINGRLVFNLVVDDEGVAHGVIEVPAGEARTFTVTAYDDHHNVTHTGSETLDVNPGSNPPLNVKLKPVAGEVAVTVTFGDYGVVVTPSAVEFDALGQTVELTATVFDQYDEEVPDAEVVWATTHPTIVSVSESGLVTALAEGQATIVATYAGVAGVSEVTVVVSGGQEVCDGIDNNGNGQADEGLTYCIGGSPAPNTDGENGCLDGWYDLDSDPTNGCETGQPLACPTAEELTTADLIDAERVAQGLDALDIDVRLVVAAQGHSADMLATGNYSHTGSDGSSYADRIAAAGYPGSGVGEVIAWTMGEGTPEQVVAMWMGSQAHRDLLLSANIRHIGVGVASSEYWTVNVGSADAALPPRSSCGGS